MSNVHECYSLNGDDWYLNDIDYIIDEIEDNFYTNEVQVFIGTPEFMQHKDYFNLSSIISDMEESAYEDFDGIDSYLSEFIENRTKSAKYIELENLILNWMNENIAQPYWYNVKNIKSISVKEFKDKYIKGEK